MLTLVTFWLYLNSPAHAEYRVFELSITDSTTAVERTELSNLDPVQYRQFHPTRAQDKIVYKATWMCRGNTSNQPYCANPKPK